MRKWCRRKKVEPCSRNDRCVSPSGHYGPCQVWQQSPRRLVFVNDDGTLFEEPVKPKPTPPDPTDPFGWRRK